MSTINVIFNIASLYKQLFSFILQSKYEPTLSRFTIKYQGLWSFKANPLIYFISVCFLILILCNFSVNTSRQRLHHNYIIQRLPRTQKMSNNVSSVYKKHLRFTFPYIHALPTVNLRCRKLNKGIPQYRYYSTCVVLQLYRMLQCYRTPRSSTVPRTFQSRRFFGALKNQFVLLSTAHNARPGYISKPDTRAPSCFRFWPSPHHAANGGHRLRSFQVVCSFVEPHLRIKHVSSPRMDWLTDYLKHFR